MKLLFISLLLFSASAHAKIFSINESSIATYFKGTFGLSQIRQHPYEKSSGAQTEFSDEAKFNYSGELGFMFPHKDYSLRFGFQILSPSIDSGISGKNSSGTELMTLDSKVLGLFPVAHLEYYVSRNALGRVYFSVGGGYGRVSLKNDYTLTAAGDTAYSPITSHSENSSQYTYLIETSVGYEMSFVQSVTMVFDFGYRYAIAKELEYSGTGTGFNGNHNSGDPVLDSDGKNKSLDLGGVFTGLSFRFYFE